MKQFVIAIMAIALITGTAMAEKAKEPYQPIQIDVNGGMSREGGDDPASAVPITALPFNDSGDTSDNSAYGGGAPDVYYSYAPTTDITVDIELCGSSFDTKLYVFDGTGAQIAGNDDYCGLQSAIYNLNLTAGDTYLICVTGYGSSAGAYVIDMTGAVPPPSDFCGLLSEAGSELSGDTTDGYDLVNGLDCAAFVMNGYEAYYEVFMPAGSSFTAAVTNSNDGALAVVSQCDLMGDCLAYADNTFGGQEEVISYTNNGADAMVYLVIDSYSAGAFTYTGTFTSTGGAVATESMSLGTIKAMFR